MSEYANLPDLIPIEAVIGEAAQDPAAKQLSQPAVDQKKPEDSKIGCDMRRKNDCPIGRGRGYQRSPAIRRMFPGAMHQLKSCDSGKTQEVRHVRTIHVYKDPRPQHRVVRPPSQCYPLAPAPRICEKKYRPAPAQRKPNRKDCCPKVTKVICVDKSLPKNVAPVKVKKVYKTNPECNPCVEQILRRQRDFLDPVAGMKHKPKVKPFDHCHMPLGPAFAVFGRGTLCTEDGIFDIKGSTDFFRDDLGENEETTLARENEAKEYFAKMFGVDFRACTPTDGIFRTHEASMYPFRIPRKIKTIVRLCSGGTEPTEQIRIYQGGFAVQMLVDFQAGGEYARMNDECVVLKKGSYLIFGLKKLQKYVETQEEVEVEDPCDPCKKSKRWETKWVPKDDPAFVSFHTEKPCEPNMDQNCIFMRSKIESADMKGFSTTTITWEKVCQGSVNFILEECWNFEADKKNRPSSDDGW